MFLTEHILYLLQILKMLLSYGSIRSLKNNSIRQKKKEKMFRQEHILYVLQILKMLVAYVSVRSLKNIRQKNRKNVPLGTYHRQIKKNVFWEIRPVGTFDWFIGQVLQISRTQAFNNHSKNLKNMSSRQKNVPLGTSHRQTKKCYEDFRPVGTFDLFIRQVLQISRTQAFNNTSKNLKNISSRQKNVPLGTSHR